MCFHIKINIMTTTMLYMDDTLDEEDVLMIFDELKEQNSHFFCKSHSREDNFCQNFLVDKQATTNFLPALHVTDNYASAL